MDVSVTGIDLGKNLCSVAGMDEAGSVVFARIKAIARADFGDAAPFDHTGHRADQRDGARRGRR